MWSLYFKEIKSYLSSILGYIFIGVFLIVSGLFIWVFPNINNVFFSGLSDLQGLFNISKFLFLFLVPAITMRTFAEERRQGTMELLLTKPIKDTQIIAAKFFSCLTLLVISLIPTLIYIVSVYNLGNPIGNIDMGSTWGSYLGLVLLGSSFIAIGIFASSITNNQIVAFILAAPLCFIFYFGPDFIYSFDALGSFGYFIKTIGIDHHYAAISRGVIDSRDIVYFLSFIFVFLFATSIVLVSRKWYNKRFKQTTLIGFAAALLILMAVNILSAFLYVRVDLTQDKRHSLSKETIKLLKELDETIYIKVYLKGADQPADYQLFAEETRAVLQEFRSYSKNIHFEFIDPVAGKNREEINNIYGEFAKKGLRPIPITRENEAGISTHYVLPGAIITYKSTEYPVTLVVSDPGYSDWLQYSIQELEYNFVATIRKLMHPIKPKVAFIDGHGELDFLNTSWIMWQLQRFYNVERVALNGKINALKEVTVKDSISNEIEVKGNKYDLLVIAQPTLPFSDADKFIIDQHIMYGGKVLWLIDATTASIDSLQNSTEQFATMRNLRLNDMFFSYGVRLNANLVQDLSCQSIPLGMGDIGGQTQYKFFAFPYNINIVNFSNHSIVRKMKEIKADFCGTIDFVGATENLNKIVLMTTSERTKMVPVPAIVTLNVARAKPNIEEFAFKNQPVAVLLEGVFKSAFANVLPIEFDTVKQFGYKDASVMTRQIFIADGDVIRNRFDPKRNQPLPAGFDVFSGKMYDNSDFILNCVNYLCSDEDLLQIRAKVFKIGSLNNTKVLKDKTFYTILNIVIPLLIISLMAGVLIVWRQLKYKRKR